MAQHQVFWGVKLLCGVKKRRKPVRSLPWKGSSVSETRDRAAPSHSGVWYLFRRKTNLLSNVRKTAGAKGEAESLSAVAQYV